MTDPVQPSPLDIENAARRREIADRFRREYEDALSLATSLFGPGWEPTGKHFLLDRDHEADCRRTGQRPVPAATVITVRNAEGRKRHFRADGEPRECETVEAGFGEMLYEPHPTKRFTWNEKEIAPHRYSLCWGWFEPDYKPKSAEQLAAARERREEKAVEREAEGSLFADIIRAEGYQPKRRGR
jgi:hypothetical protein